MQSQVLSIYLYLYTKIYIKTKKKSILNGVGVRKGERERDISVEKNVNVHKLM